MGVVDYLTGVLRELHQRHHMNEVIIVAHGTGGLVSRGVLNGLAHDDVRVSALITIATPWNGSASASVGNKWSPALAPSWVDLVPNSDYIRALYRTPSTVPHHLLFTTVDDADGVMSQLDYRAQLPAADVRGFHVDLDALLKQPALTQRVRAIVAAAQLADSPSSP